MNDDLRRALDVALSDVRRSGFEDVKVIDSEWGRAPIQTGALLASPLGQVGVSILFEQSPADQLVAVADQVQDFVHELILLPAGRPVVWPECPIHPGSHPLTAVDDEELGPAWRCVPSGRTLARIGELGK
jgi:hypothetical protein